MNIFNPLSKIVLSRWYWLLLGLMAISAEIVALFYQYYLDEPPCVLCIHVRIWFLGLFCVAILGYFLANHQKLRFIMPLLSIGIFAGLAERSYQLYGVEQGFIMGSCDMTSGLPAWFALDKWIPAIFEVQTTCGYTPELFFKITMAEALLVYSVLFFVLSIGLFLSLFLKSSD